MIYLLFTIVALVSVGAIELYAARKGVVDFGDKIKVYKPCVDENIVPFKGKSLILITTICFVITLLTQILLNINAPLVSCIKLYGLLLIVLCAGLIDYKRRIIPNQLILIGLVFRVGIYVYEILFDENIKAIFINDLIGFVIGFVLLAFISIITKGSLGFGDVKLFGVIGITSGAFCTYSTLMVSLVLSVIVSVFSIARKKMGRKDSFPFGPCIALGYVISVLLTSY